MSKAKLQVALDFLNLSRAMEVAEAAVAGGADILEVGTPLLKSEGLDAVRKLRERFNAIPIVADTKTMDAGRIEAESAAKAGATIMTVLGAADKSTIRECVEAGKHYGIQVAVDLLGVPNPVDLSGEAEKLGVDWIDVHCAIDQQMGGSDPLALLRKVRENVGITVAVAGGINSETAAEAVAAGADVVIVGGAITKAVDVKQATGAIKQAIETGTAVETRLFKRARADQLRDVLSQVRTCNISDAAHRRPCLPDIRPLAPGQFACGPAVTVRTLPGDWAKPVEAIDLCKPGDVLVIDACGQPPAIWGELASESAKNAGVAGLVVNGAVRDSGDIRNLGFAVWSSHVTSHAGDPHGHGEINGPVTIGGQRICAGDWIVADDDGVMVLPKAQAVELANRAQNVLEAENRIRAEIRDNDSTLAKVVNLSRWEKQKGGPIVG